MKSVNLNSEKFGQMAETFARFFGTPKFIVGQTVFVLLWIVYNIASNHPFDIYPFILLNLAFSTQAAYAAPLILLAQSRQADRDRQWAAADTAHRESVAVAAHKRQKAATDIDKKIVKLIQEQARQNEMILQLSQRIEPLIEEVHRLVTQKKD